MIYCEIVGVTCLGQFISNTKKISSSRKIIKTDDVYKFDQFYDKMSRKPTAKAVG